MLRGMAAQPRKSADILDAVALLVVDMQGPFLNVIEGSSSVVERCGFAIEAARALGLRVVFTEQVPDKLGATEPRLRALVPNARVFSKSTFSALQANGLIDHLRRQGIYHLMIVGIEIPVCIYQTALHAIDSDFDVTVLSDCVTGRRMDDCIITLEALARAHVHVLPAEAVFYSMLGHAGHPRFPAFNALVKRYAEPGALDAAPAAPEPAHESRPQLVAAEDRETSAQDDDAQYEPDDSEGERDDEPYIGRDGAGHSEADAPGAGADESEEEAESSEGGHDDADSPDGYQESGSSGDSPESEHGGGRRRRGRRRRGGARRRRARERAATGAVSHGEPVAESESNSASGPEESASDREPAVPDADHPDERSPE